MLSIDQVDTHVRTVKPPPTRQFPPVLMNPLVNSAVPLEQVLQTHALLPIETVDPSTSGRPGRQEGCEECQMNGLEKWQDLGYSR